MEIFKYYKLRYDKISPLGNTFLRQIRINIKKIKTSSDQTQILNILSEAISSLANFQGISKILSIITKDKTQTGWNGIFKMMEMLSDEIYSDRDIYKILKNIKKKNLSKKHDEFLTKLIDCFVKMGCNTNQEKQLKILKIRDIVIQYKSDIQTYINTGSPIEYCKALTQWEKYKQISSDGVEYINLTLNNYKLFMETTSEESTRKYINVIFSDYVSHILPKFIKMNIYRHNYSKLLDYTSFSKFQENKELISRYGSKSWEKISEIIEKTLSECINELRNIQFAGKNTIYNIYYGFEEKKKQLINAIPEKLRYFKLEQMLINILITMTKLFNLTFKNITSKSQKLNDNTLVFLINDYYFYIDLTENNNNYSDIIKFNEKSLLFIPNKKQEILFSDIIDISNKICTCLCLIIKQNEHILLNDIQDDDIYFISCLIEKYITENIYDIIEINDETIIKKIIETTNIQSSFDIIRLCSLSIIDNYITTDETFIKNSRNVLNKGSDVSISTTNKIIHNFISQIFNNTSFKVPKKIQPFDIIDLLDNFNGKLYYKIIIKLIASNFWISKDCNNDLSIWITIVDCVKSSKSIFTLLD
jgi:hypothetical protein